MHTCDKSPPYFLARLGLIIELQKVQKDRSRLVLTVGIISKNVPILRNWVTMAQIYTFSPLNSLFLALPVSIICGLKQPHKFSIPASRSHYGKSPVWSWIPQLQHKMWLRFCKFLQSECNKWKLICVRWPKQFVRVLIQLHEITYNLWALLKDTVIYIYIHG